MSKFTSYEECLDYLLTRLPMFQRIGGAAYNKDLSRTIRLVELIGNPHKKLRFIHVAGTNGKGSVSHMLASVFSAVGFRTGLYTSPHLTDFRERISVDGEYIAKEEVLRFVNSYQEVLEPVQPSFFEWTFALALDHFRQSECDIVILETGMGGRLDSTNIVDPEISVITNIGMDHMQFLGNTKAEIAAEKAGIIKPGKPVVIGQRNQETYPVFIEKAYRENSPLYMVDEHIKAKWLNPSQIELKVAEYTRTYNPGLKGDYQLENISTALLTCYLLHNTWKITDEALKEGFENVQKHFPLRGRWQIIQENPTVICEAAHNKDGIETALRNLSAYTYQKLHVVFGMVADKSPDIPELIPPSAALYISAPDIPRAMPVEQLSGILQGLHRDHTTHTSIKSAIQAALHSADSDDLILIFGSIFTVAEAIAFFESDEFNA